MIICIQKVMSYTYLRLCGICTAFRVSTDNLLSFSVGFYLKHL